MFKVLLRSSIDPNLFFAEGPGQSVSKDVFHHVADVDCDTTDSAFARLQNGNPELDNPTLTWAKDRKVTLTSEGERLKSEIHNGSLRSLSAGDILIHSESGEIWMVESCGWYIVDDDGPFYTVAEH